MKRKNRKDQIGTSSILIESLRLGTFAGLLFGLVFGLEVGALGDLLPYPRDSFIFILYFSIVFWVLSAVGMTALSLIYCAITKLIGNRVSLKNIRQIIVKTIIFVFVFSQGMIAWIELNRPIFFNCGKMIAGLFITLALSILIAVLLGRVFIRISPGPEAGKSRRLRQKMRFLIPSYFVIMFVGLVIIASFISQTPINKEKLQPVEGENKILFLGVDAANWELLDPLLEQGLLPNFAHLIDNGARGPLPSIVSMYNPFANTITRGIKSAAVWTSILTGKSPMKHGIKDFIFTEIPGIHHPFRYPLLPSFTPSRKKVEKFLGLRSRPYFRALLKTKAAWHIYSDLGLEAAALGWWETWPAEDLPGEILTDRFDDLNLPKRWSPQSFISNDEVEALVEKMKNPDSTELAAFTSFPYRPDYKEIFSKESREYMRNDLVKNLVKSYYQDKFRSDLGLRLLQEREYAFMSVYFYGLDTVGHAFWRFMEPALFIDVEPEEIEYFGDIIKKYCRFIDEEIGKYLELVDENTSIVAVSDHGMGPWLGARLAKKGVRLSGSHREKGVVILSGAGIRKGVTIHPKNVLDILPTTLYLSGLPVAKDMDGKVIVDAIEPQILSKRPIEYISTFETKRYKFQRILGLGSERSMDKTQMERLKALGYVK